MRTYSWFLGLVGLLLAAGCQPSKSNNGVFLLTDFGGDPTGETLSTDALQQAIDAAAERGGGEVLVPPGTYLIGTVYLRDNTTLNVPAGATLLGSPRIEDYTETEWGHNDDRQPYHLIVVKQVKNVEIKGLGTIDGNGEHFWQDYDPANDPQWVRPKEKKVSPMLEILEASDVRIRDVSLKTGGGWTCHIMHSRNVVVDGVRIINSLFAPNADGIDITGSQDVRVSNCDISTCDDAIVLKTMEGGQPCEDITVTNCTLETLCGALKLGTESWADFRRITFSNCAVKAASRAFSIYIRDGGTAEDITVSNIVSTTKAPLVLNRPIHLMIAQRRPDSKVGAIRNVQIDQFMCETDGRILMTALPGATIDNVSISKLHLRYPFIEDPAPVGQVVKSGQFPQDFPELIQKDAAIVAANMTNLQIRDVTVEWPGSTVPEDWQIPIRLINGDFDLRFRHDYSSPRQTELGLFYGQNLQSGFLEMPLASPSAPDKPKVELVSSTIKTL